MGTKTIRSRHVGREGKVGIPGMVDSEEGNMGARELTHWKTTVLSKSIKIHSMGSCTKWCLQKSSLHSERQRSSPCSSHEAVYPAWGCLRQRRGVFRFILRRYV